MKQLLIFLILIFFILVRRWFILICIVCVLSKHKVEFVWYAHTWRHVISSAGLTVVSKVMGHSHITIKYSVLWIKMNWSILLTEIQHHLRFLDSEIRNHDKPIIYDCVYVHKICMHWSEMYCTCGRLWLALVHNAKEIQSWGLIAG